MQKLGFQVAFNHFWTGKYDKVPSGCSIDKVKRPYLEQSAAGLGKGRNDLTPICKKPFHAGRFLVKQAILTLKVRRDKKV